jgi:hypothetical protein
MSPPTIKTSCESPDCWYNQNERYDKQQTWNLKMEQEHEKISLRLEKITFQVGIIVGIGVAAQTVIILAFKLLKV